MLCNTAEGGRYIKDYYFILKIAINYKYNKVAHYYQVEVLRLKKLTDNYYIELKYPKLVIYNRDGFAIKEFRIYDLRKKDVVNMVYAWLISKKEHSITKHFIAEILFAGEDLEEVVQNKATEIQRVMILNASKTLLLNLLLDSLSRREKIYISEIKNREEIPFGEIRIITANNVKVRLTYLMMRDESQAEQLLRVNKLIFVVFDDSPIVDRAIPLLEKLKVKRFGLALTRDEDKINKIRTVVDFIKNFDTTKDLTEFIANEIDDFTRKIR